jgi:hypothetical protein
MASTQQASDFVLDVPHLTVSPSTLTHSCII